MSCEDCQRWLQATEAGGERERVSLRVPRGNSPVWFPDVKPGRSHAQGQLGGHGETLSQETSKHIFFRVKSQMSLFSAHRTVVVDTGTWHKRPTREAHFKHHGLLFPQGPVTYLVLFSPNDLCWDLDLVHVLMQRVSGFLTNDFQKHLWGKKHIVSVCRVYTSTTTARDSSGPDHSMDRGLQITRQPATKLQAGVGLLTLPVEAVMRDANINKALKDLRMKNPQLGNKRSLTSSLLQLWGSTRENAQHLPTLPRAGLVNPQNVEYNWEALIKTKLAGEIAQ